MSNALDWFLRGSGVVLWVGAGILIMCGLYWRWLDRQPKPPLEYRPRSAKP